MKVGQRVQRRDGSRGTVIAIDEQGFLTVAWDNDSQTIELPARLSLVGAS